MKLKSFLKLVEIQTKVASMIPLLLGSVYTLYHFKTFNIPNFLLMFLSLLMFDMATTAINNFIDYRKAHKTYGYGYEVHNAIVQYDLTSNSVMITIFTLIGLAVFFGILLFVNTNLIVLLIGALSFLIGILYSFGPVPISRTPLGEIFSGLCMGFVIVFLAVYIHICDQSIILLSYESGMIHMNLNIIEIFYIFLVSLPSVFGISNIMLANNICDIEDDIANQRYTLPIYIGKKRALSLFKNLYYLGFIIIIVLLILQVIPPLSSLVLLTFIPINKNIKLFFQKQSKKDTFVLAVKNFVLLNASYLISIAAGILLA